MPADAAVRRARLRAQRLEPRSREGVAAVVRAVCGIQAQDAAAARLSVRARAEGAVAADVDAAALVRTWAWRGTLHLLAAEDVPWVLELVAPGAIRGTAARWRQLGLGDAVYARARETLVAALADGPRTRAELRERLAADGVDASGQRLPHLARRGALEGLLELRLDGSFAALRTGSAPPRADALAELGRRYAAAYGPASARDLARWSGLGAAAARTAWEAADPDAAPPPGHDRPSVRLLPSFDTYLLGYADRGDVVAPEHAARVWPGGGWLHPVLLVDGRAAGTWRMARGAVEVEPFGPLSGDVAPAVAAEVDDVRRFLAG